MGGTLSKPNLCYKTVVALAFIGVAASLDLFIGI